MKKILIVMLAVCTLFTEFCFKQQDKKNLKGIEVNIPEQSDSTFLSEREEALYAVDGLGRVLPTSEETGECKKDKFVGLFYWTWHVGQSSSYNSVKNVNSIASEHPEAVHNISFPGWGEFYQPHHWNEPLYGFYDTDDRWVLRRHAELLAAADVDVIIFDNTNGTFTWKDSYDVLFEVFDEARRDGVKTPQIAFLLPFFSQEDTTTQLRMLYEDIYSQGRYKDLWFYWKGKPLIMAYPDGLDTSEEKIDKEIFSFFTFRPGIAQYNKDSYDAKKGNTFFSKAFDRNRYWSWLSVYPQALNRNPDGSIEEIAVGVAQNWSAELGLTAMNGENVFGRTYTSKGVDTSDGAKLKGANFAEQFEYAIANDPEFIFITGWNEWVAGRFDEWCGVVNAFPDEFNDEFSRDIEPSKGDLKDNYYYQMVSYIRKFKGTKAGEEDTSLITVNSFEDWDKVSKTYNSYAGNTFDRDDIGYANIRYTDNSGRNDIVAAKVASDKDNIYFLAVCNDTITPQTDENWMRLLISTGGETTFEGYDYIINRNSPVGGKTVVERSKGGYDWEKAGDANIYVNGKMIYIAVPKNILGITSNSFSLDFKWTDNTLENGDIMTLYTFGDSAPLARFNFRYTHK